MRPDLIEGCSNGRAQTLGSLLKAVAKEVPLRLAGGDGILPAPEFGFRLKIRRCEARRTRPV